MTEQNSFPHNPQQRHPIGVFDSGVGGLSVLRALRAELPHEDFIYVADAGFAPYGEREECFVVQRSRFITQHLLAHEQRPIKALVIACNTATAASIHLLRQELPSLPIVGVEPALKPAVASSRTKRIGVMATRGTLASAKFKALLARRKATDRWHDFENKATDKALRDWCEANSIEVSD